MSKRLSKRAADIKVAQKPADASAKLSKEEQEAVIKAESDKRRSRRKKRNIRIHLDHIENLDETAERIRTEGEEAKETGYTSVARIYYMESRLNWLRKIINSMTSWAYPYDQCCCPMKYINRIELTRNFVKIKVVTRCVTMFSGKNKGKKTGLIMQPVPMEFLNRMAVEHIEKKPFAWLRRYPYYADLNSYSAVELFRIAGINPLVTKRAKFRLIELTGKERDQEIANYYRLQPIGNYIPMELSGSQA